MIMKSVLYITYIETFHGLEKDSSCKYSINILHVLKYSHIVKTVAEEKNLPTVETLIKKNIISFFRLH